MNERKEKIVKRPSSLPKPESKREQGNGHWLHIFYIDRALVSVILRDRMGPVL